VRALIGELPGELFAGMFALNVTGAKYEEPARSASAGGDGGVVCCKFVWLGPEFIAFCGVRRDRRDPGQSLGQPSSSSEDWSTSESKHAFQRGAGGGEDSKRGRKVKFRRRGGIGAGMDLMVVRGGVSGGVRIA